MPRGPLPEKNTRRRNAPTIPTTDLNPAGPDFDPPEVPESYVLGEAGQAFWAWAWSMPQACAWDDGVLYAVARRAMLEDYLVVLEQAEQLDIDELLSYDEEQIRKMLQQLEFVISKLASMARGSISAMKEARELDNKLGLNPAAMAALRWQIVDKSDNGSASSPPATPPKKAPAKKKSSAKDPRERLSLVKTA